MIKRVQQVHKTGCGVACLAMITGFTYKQVSKKLWRVRKPGCKYSTSIKNISSFLKKNNLKYKVHMVNGHKLNIKNSCILGVRWETDDGKKIIPSGWHWVVLHKNKILDPWMKPVYTLKKCQKRTFIILEVLN